jgi:hypothetical protein
MQRAFRPAIIALASLLAHSAVCCGRPSDVASVLSEFSPDRWPQHDRDRYLALQGLSYNDAPKRLQQSAVMYSAAPVCPSNVSAIRLRQSVAGVAR